MVNLLLQHLSTNTSPLPPPPRARKKVKFQDPIDDRTRSDIPGIVGRLQDLARARTHQSAARPEVYQVRWFRQRYPWLCSEREADKMGVLAIAGMRSPSQRPRWGMEIEPEPVDETMEEMVEETVEVTVEVTETVTGIDWFFDSEQGTVELEQERPKKRKREAEEAEEEETDSPTETGISWFGESPNKSQ